MVVVTLVAVDTQTHRIRRTKKDSDAIRCALEGSIYEPCDWKVRYKLFCFKTYFLERAFFSWKVIFFPSAVLAQQCARGPPSVNGFSLSDTFFFAVVSSNRDQRCENEEEEEGEEKMKQNQRT